MGMIRVVFLLQFLVERKSVEKVHSPVVVSLTNPPIEVVWVLPQEPVAGRAGLEMPSLQQSLVDDTGDSRVDDLGVR